MNVNEGTNNNAANTNVNNNNNNLANMSSSTLNNPLSSSFTAYNYSVTPSVTPYSTNPALHQFKSKVDLTLTAVVKQTF